VILIAPFSNDVLRNWPSRYFTELIQSLLDAYDDPIIMVGAAEQRQAINAMVRQFSSDRVSNVAGVWTWRETVNCVGGAKLVIANNSGVAHLGANAGVATLCLFAASHDPFEWGPRGPRVTTVFTKPACAPCGMSGANGCTNGHVFMTDLRPCLVFSAARRMLGVPQSPST